jgi:hypothetical protein
MALLTPKIKLVSFNISLDDYNLIYNYRNYYNISNAFSSFISQRKNIFY